jgi:hypothetical protein
MTDAGGATFGGAVGVTGQLTLGSTITNGTYTYTLPSATGTLALVGGAGVGTVTSVAALTLGTSGTDLSSTVANGTTTPVITLNVPDASATARGVITTGTQTIAGAKTLTGALSGTSATFSGAVDIGTSSNALNQKLNVYGDTIRIGVQSVNNTNSGVFFKVMNGATQTGNATLRVDNAGKFSLFNGTTGESENFTIASTGAATFSSSVTAGGYLFSNTTSPNSSGLQPQLSGTTKGYFATAGTTGDLLNEAATGDIIIRSNLGKILLGTYVSGAPDAYTGLCIANNRNVGIGTTSPNAPLTVKTDSAAQGINIWGRSDDFAVLRFQNAAGSFSNATIYATNTYLAFETAAVERMRISSGGMLYVPGIYNNTNSNAANVWVNSDGSLYRSTSSLKYKKNVENYTKGLAEVMKLRPVIYEGKFEIDEGKIFAGLIAEEVHELGLTEFVQYAEDGSPDALSYSNMVSLLVKAIQEQQAQIEELKALIKPIEPIVPKVTPEPIVPTDNNLE